MKSKKNKRQHTQHHWPKALLILAGLAMSGCGEASDKIVKLEERYRVIGAGEVIEDKVTGLHWQRCSVGQEWDGTTCTGSFVDLSWWDALEQEVDGWRLPTAEELNSIVFCSNTGIFGPDNMSTCSFGDIVPTLHPDAFPTNGEHPVRHFNFWTSTSEGYSATRQRRISFISGSLGIADHIDPQVGVPVTNFVRLVRSPE